MGVIAGGQVMTGPRRFYTDFKAPPIAVKKTGGIPVGTTGGENLLWVPGTVENGRPSQPGILPLEYFVIGAGQTILQPQQTAVGLDIGMDQTSTEGIEITGGILSRGPMVGTLGTDELLIRLKVKVQDASGVGKLLVGWRRAEAYQADWNDYLDLVSIGINGTANPNTIQLQTILNNAATTTTNTTNTWADAAEKSLTCIIGKDRKALYQINDAAPTTVAAFTGDNGDTFIPFILFTHAADVAGTVELTELDIRLA